MKIVRSLNNQDYKCTMWIDLISNLLQIAFIIRIHSFNFLENRFHTYNMSIVNDEPVIYPLNAF